MWSVYFVNRVMLHFGTSQKVIHSQLFIYRNEAISVAQYLCFMLSKGKLLTADIENIKGLKITQDLIYIEKFLVFTEWHFFVSSGLFSAVNAEAVEN